MSIVQPEPEQPDFVSDLLNSIQSYEFQPADFSHEFWSSIIEDYNFYSYSAAAFGYALLLVLALLRSQKNPVNIFFVLAVSASLVSFSYTAFALNTPAVYISEALPLETLYYAGWFLFLIILIIHQQFNDQFTLLTRYRLVYVMPLLVIAALLLETNTDFRYFIQQIIGFDPRFFFHLVFAIIGLVLIEQLYRNGTGELRWSVKFLCLGLGTQFLVDFVLYSHSLLYEQLDFTIWDSRGFIHLLTIPLLAISISRIPEDTLAAEISVSRQVVFHTAILFGAGIYLLLMSAAGYYIRDYGGSWGKIAQMVFVSVATLLLMIFLFSGKFRAQARVFLNKHFFQYSYDYREEWLKLSKTLSELNSLQQLSGFIIKTMADLVDSTGGGLWLKNQQGEFYLAEDCNLGFQDLQTFTSDDPVIQFLRNRHWIIDFVEYRQTPKTYAEVDLSQWLAVIEKAWMIIPLFHQDDIQAFIVLSTGRVPRRLNWEDRDLLKTVAMQLSNALALGHASQELSLARQFEAYNRLSAYLVHDLKNLVAQITLIVKNADTYKHDPEFIDDSLETLKNVCKKLQRLVDQLKKGRSGKSSQSNIDLIKVITDVAIQQAGNKPAMKTHILTDDCMVQGEKQKMAAILSHLVQNAQEATPDDGLVKLELCRDQQWATIKIIDTGIGMDSKFITERLFKPFDTTKGNAGMGIGVYEARDYILKQSGQISVDSTPGKGTQFTIRLPLSNIQG